MTLTSRFTHRLTIFFIIIVIGLALLIQTGQAQTGTTYPIVDTGQTACDDASAEITCPAEGDPFYGQDAQLTGNAPSYTNNGDGTISDNVTGLMWQQDDSGTGYNWSEALTYCESLSTAGYDDWRLPNVKELQSLVDYGRSPDTPASAAIDPLFNATQITNEAGNADYAAYWSSTTHANLSHDSGANGAYVNFGRSMGYMNGSWLDVHGAGAQRSDSKTGDPTDYPTGRGPQGDAIRIDNYTRCVRGGDVTETPGGDPITSRSGITVESTGSNQSMQPGGSPPSGEPGQRNGQSGPPTNGQPQPGQDGQPSNGQQQRLGGSPPSEAVGVCNGQSQGAACQFTSPHGQITGTCRQIEQQLACVPAGGPPPPPGQ